MLLFHGSDIRVEKPNVKYSRANLDFGEGFYLTTIKAQAINWAIRKAIFSKTTPVLNIYEIDEDVFKNYSVRIFEKESDEWLEFVVVNRRGENTCTSYDVVYGPVADDRVFEAVNMYLEGLWNKKTTLKALKFYDLSDQFCLKNQELIERHLKFKDSSLVYK